jgi:hypothetical protein
MQQLPPLPANACASHLPPPRVAPPAACTHPALPVGALICDLLAQRSAHAGAVHGVHARNALAHHLAARAQGGGHTRAGSARQQTQESAQHGSSKERQQQWVRAALSMHAGSCPLQLGDG